MNQYIYGPAVTDSCVLYTLVGEDFYYLKPGNYFGKASDKLNQLPLKLTVEDGYRLTDSSGKGFIYDPQSGTSILSSESKGQFTFVYPNQNVTSGTGLLYGVPIQMIVNSVKLTFLWKSPENESGTGYDGVVNSYFLVGINAYSSKDCIKYQNGAFLAYGGDSEYQYPWYSTLEWCQNKTPTAPCTGGSTCGTCYGPCSTEGEECIPDPGTGKLKCRPPGEEPKPWYLQIWFWIVIAVAVILIVFVLFYFFLIK